MLYSFDFMIPFSFNMDFLSVLVLPLKNETRGHSQTTCI